MGARGSRFADVRACARRSSRSRSSPPSGAAGRPKQWGEPFVVRIDGLIPGEQIQITSSTKLADGNYRGQATFTADASGKIDTGITAAVSGSYTGADADGLVWSMAKTTKAIPAAAQYAFHVDVAAADGTALGAATLDRWYVADGVTRVPVSDNGLVGVFYAPPGKTKLPVIVTFGGSEGGLSSGEDAAMFYLAKIAMDRLVANGHDKRFADESVCYPDSGHFSTGTPGVPTALQTAVVHPLTGELLALGGTPQGIAKAQRDAFGRVDRFLAAALR